MTIYLTLLSLALAGCVALCAALYVRTWRLKASLRLLRELTASEFTTYRRWLGELPEVAAALEHLYGDLTGQTLDGKPVGPDHRSLSDFRDELRRVVRRRNEIAKPAPGRVDLERWAQSNQQVIGWLERYGIKVSSKGFAELRTLVFGAPDLPVMFDFPAVASLSANDAAQSIETSEREAR